MKKYFKYTKKQNQWLWRHTRLVLGKQLTELRQKLGRTNQDLNQLTLVPIYYLENMELGKGNLDLNYVLPLAWLYGKRLKIELADLTDEERCLLPSEL